MSETDWKIPAIKYHQIHGLDPSTPVPKKTDNSTNELQKVPILGWWKNRVKRLTLSTGSIQTFKY